MSRLLRRSLSVAICYDARHDHFRSATWLRDEPSCFSSSRLSVLINYIDRSNLSIAAPLIKDEFRISAWQLGKLLSAFFWTYAFMQIPAGWLVDRFDVKWVFAAGFFCGRRLDCNYRISARVHGALDHPRDSGARRIGRLSLLRQDPVRSLQREPARLCERHAHGGLGARSGARNVGRRKRRRTFWVASILCHARLGGLCSGFRCGLRGCHAERWLLLAPLCTRRVYSTFCGNGQRGARVLDSPPSITTFTFS